MIHAVIPLALSLALPWAPAAMSPMQDPELEPVEVLPWPTSLGADDFGRMEAARLLPAHGRSIVIQRGATLALAYAPALHTLLVELQSSATAFAVLPGDPSGTHMLDRIVYADTTGLRLGAFDTTQNPPVFQSSAIAGTTALANAFALSCADLDADGYADLVAVDAARSTVWTLRGDDQDAFVLGASFAAAGEVLDLRPLQWNGIGGAEVAVASRWGTQVFSNTGSQVWHRFAYDPGTSDDPNVVMTVVPAPIGSGAKDQLAVVQWNQYGTNQLLSVHGDTASDPPISLSHANLGLVIEHPLGSGDYLGVVGMHAGDRDGDGDFDLALSHHKERRVQVFINRGEPTTYSAIANFLDTIDVGDGPGLFVDHSSTPLMADLDDDGFAELALANPENSPSLVLMHGSSDIANMTLDCADSPVFDDYKVLGLRDGQNSMGQDIDIEIKVTNGWNASMSAQGITHLEVVVWRQDVADIDYVTEAIGHYVFERTSTFDLPDSDMSVTFPIDIATTVEMGELEVFLKRYYVEIRPVHYEVSTQTISNPMRTHVAGFTSALENGTSSLQVLLGRPGAALDSICEGDANETLNNKYVGGLVPQLKVPILPPGTLPNIPNPPTVFLGQ